MWGTKVENSEFSGLSSFLKVPKTLPGLHISDMTFLNGMLRYELLGSSPALLLVVGNAHFPTAVQSEPIPYQVEA